MIPDWKITRICNGTHQVTFTHKSGKKLEVTVPEEHRHSHEARATYLKSHVQTHHETMVKVIDTIKKITPKEREQAYPRHYILWTIIILETFGIVLYSLFGIK
jgi:hypothetical protein